MTKIRETLYDFIKHTSFAKGPIMTESTPPTKPESPLQNPQIVAAIIGGLVTVLVAIVGIIPAIINHPATPTPVIVTATPVPATATAVLVANVVASATPIPPTPVPATDVPPTTLPLVQPAATQPPIQLSPVGYTGPQQPATGNALLMYDDVSFTVLNQGTAKLSLVGVVFRSKNGEWDARKWGPSLYDRLPANRCLRLRISTSGNRQPPAACGNPIFGLQLVNGTALFWVNVDSFDVVRDDQTIATCQIADKQCVVNF
jgi:hypothetical protein